MHDGFRAAPRATVRLPAASKKPSKNSTARMAPIGSMRVPSASRMLATRPRRPIARTSGPTTVGPVTTRTAASNQASGHGMSKIALRGQRCGHERDTGADRQQPPHRRAGIADPLDAEAQRAFEEDDRHRHRHGGEQQVAEDRVGFEESGDRAHDQAGAPGGTLWREPAGANPAIVPPRPSTGLPRPRGVTSSPLAEESEVTWVAESPTSCATAVDAGDHDRRLRRHWGSRSSLDLLGAFQVEAEVGTVARAVAPPEHRPRPGR